MLKPVDEYLFRSTVAVMPRTNGIAVELGKDFQT